MCMIHFILYNLYILYVIHFSIYIRYKKFPIIISIDLINILCVTKLQSELALY